MKDWRLATSGSRFNPFPDSAGINVPTLYVAVGFASAALESVFHEVPHTAAPAISGSQIDTWEFVELRAARDFTVVELTNPQLRQLEVSSRVESLREDELIHSAPSQYPQTRTWAKALHDRMPTADGLTWRPRLAGEGQAYVLFGDRCSTLDLEVLGSPTPLTEAPAALRIREVAIAANIRIINTT